VWSCVKGFPIIKEHMYIYHYFPQDVCAIDQPLVQEHQQLIFP